MSEEAVASEVADASKGSGLGHWFLAMLGNGQASDRSRSVQTIARLLGLGRARA